MDNHITVGKKVWIPSIGKTGVAIQTDARGNITKVDVGGEIIDTANKVVQLWDLLSFFYRLIISIFKKKK